MLLQIQNRDKELFEHCIRTATLTKLIMLNLGYYDEELYDAALVHDIGKIHIPPQVLYKPDKLEENERMVVDYHAYYSYRTLHKYHLSEKTCQYVLFHHGPDRPRVGLYPEPDEEILVGVEPLIAADIFDALTSNRCYCAHIDACKSLDILQKEQDVSEQVFDALEKCVKQYELYANLA